MSVGIQRILSRVGTSGTRKRETKMIKAIVMIAEYVALRVKLACTKNRAKRVEMLSRFERKTR